MKFEELYFRLKHKETRERLAKRVKFCEGINEIISSTENPIEFQRQYEQLWEENEDETA